jgi:hypothetical protein
LPHNPGIRLQNLCLAGLVGGWRSLLRTSLYGRIP